MSTPPDYQHEHHNLDALAEQCRAAAVLQAFSLHSSVSSPGLHHQSSDPSGMATPQRLEHASSGASQLQQSVDAPHQVHNVMFYSLCQVHFAIFESPS